MASEQASASPSDVLRKTVTESSSRQHHRRPASTHRPVKETRNARSHHINSEDDGASQRRINQYLIQQEIGRGSFGAVHVATDQFGQEYAVKEFSKSRLRRRAKSNLLKQARQKKQHSSPGRDDRLDSIPLTLEEDSNVFDLIKEEIAIMKKLHHENLVSLVEVLDDPEEDSLYMVLEMCKKGVVMRIDIEETVPPYGEENCRFWFRDLILGVEYRKWICFLVTVADLILPSKFMLKASSIGISSPTIAFSLRMTHSNWLILVSRKCSKSLPR